jgi:DNA polymerase III alpha subunit/nucleotidyltransferase/DNA polymerase involved in DNA repair
MPRRSIVHLDADAFFAAVEQAADPKLRGKAVAVGGEKRGIIASASYEARQFGVYTPMPTARARKLCPRLIVLPGDFERYEQFSHWMFGYCYDFTPEVEQTSIDEGYFDLSGVRKPAADIALTIRKAIGQRLKITVSEGIGTNKLVSSVASKLTKPAAFYEVPPGQEAAYLQPLPNKWLPGVGPKTSARLNAAGLMKIGQLGTMPLALLELLLGNQAPVLRQFANGIDERPLVPARQPQKTFSQQETFAADLTDEEYAEAVLKRMADHLFATVREENRSIRTVTVRVRYNDMDEDQVSESLREPSDLETDVYGLLPALLRRAWKRRVSLRLVSLKLSNLYDTRLLAELPLPRELAAAYAYGDRSAVAADARRRIVGQESRVGPPPYVGGYNRDHAASARLAAQVDALRKAHGHSIILRGHDFRLRSPPTEPVHAPRLTRLPRRLVRRRLGEGGSAAKAGHASRLTSHVCPCIPLRAHSYYSFLDSTLSPAAIVRLAQQHNLPAIALTDTGNLHGAVEFALAAKEAGIKPLLGAELRLDNQPLLLYVESARGYHNLCQLLSRHAERTAPNAFGMADGTPVPLATGEAPAPLFSVAAQQRLPFRHGEFDGFTDGLIAVGNDARLPALFPGRVYRMAAAQGAPEDFPVVACPPVHYATPADRQKFDIIQSIRTLTLLREEHPEKDRGSRRHFRAPAELAQRCHDHPEWLRHTLGLAERCQFELPFGKPQFPAYQPPDGSAPGDFLRRLALAGLRRRYGSRAGQHRPQVLQELAIINEVGYDEYFLITWDFLQECRRRGLEWITRGSAADSLVCYCLGISGVCPIRFELYFRRFLNRERMALHKLPDIDIDFAHDAKDDVVELIFEKYGPERCAVVGGFSTFQGRSAFAEVAKVLGVAEREVRRFTDHFPWSFGGGWVPDEPAPSGGRRLIEMLRASPENRDLPLDEEPYRTALETAEFLDGFPRYPKMHPCGVVLSRQPMRELTPTFIANKGYPTTHFDMDAVEVLGLVKMDILAQGGLAAMRDVKKMLADRGIEIDLDRCVAMSGSSSNSGAGVPPAFRSEPPGMAVSGETPAPLPPSDFGFESVLPAPAPENALWQDPAVWDMIASGNARAVHHIESPAMTSLSRMCNVREIDGLIAIVSVIRPGAANEGKKRAFTRRYQGLEPVAYPHPCLEPCLRSTFGLVVYEEHILQLCEVFAGLSPGRADVLRRALNKQKRAVIEEIRGEFFASALARGHAPEKISEVWDLATGFAGYAFCKAHSTAYGVEAYQSAWLKRYFPAEFMAAVLSNGKGFYDPLVYVLEACRLGLKLLPPSVNEPGPAFVPHGHSIRVPLLRVKGLTQRTADKILAARQQGPFLSLADFFHRVAPAAEEFGELIRAGGFDEFGEPRTRQFWQAQYLLRTFASAAEPTQGWLLAPEDPNRLLPHLPLTEPTRRERLEAETELFGFAVSGHPLELFSHIAWDTYCPVNRLGEFTGQTVAVCGLVVEQRIHHQITGEPMKFLSLADWTGITETELFAQTYKSYGLATVRHPVLELEARVEPFDNGCGFSLRALAARAPRTRPGPVLPASTSS